MRYTMFHMKKYREFKKRTLKNPKIERAYLELEPEFHIITLLIRRRLEEQLTQKELAKRIGTKQSAISRLESGTYNPSLALLYKIADALNARLKISVSVR